jgi:hypothetical protein
MNTFFGIAAHHYLDNRSASVLIRADSRASVVTDLHAVGEGERAANYANAAAERRVSR